MLLTLDSSKVFFFFFFNDTATTEIYTLSLHDALPISLLVATVAERDQLVGRSAPRMVQTFLGRVRSEEHTSELQSQSNLVCRLLLEKKKKKLICISELINESYEASKTVILFALLRC